MRTASASAFAGSAAWCSACDSSATSTLASFERQLLELAALPLDVRHRPPLRGRAWRAFAASDGLGAIDGDHALREPARFDRQVAFAAAEIGDLERRQQVPERARPRRPAPARDDLPRSPSAPWSSKFSFRTRRTSSSRASSARPSAVAAAASNCARSSGHTGPKPFAPRRSASAQPEVREPAVAALLDEPGVLEQPEMPRHARLRDPEDRRQLADVQALRVQQPQDAQARLVAEQAEQAAGAIVSINLHSLMSLSSRGRANRLYSRRPSRPAFFQDP
jgi:hypothetical protein